MPHLNRFKVYNPYGYCPFERPAFTSERFDSLSALYHLGAGHRGFSPILMRFVSPDSLSPFADGGLNPYSYCNNDPINSVDPSGRAGVRINLQNRQSHPPLTTRSKILIRLDAPAYVKAPNRRDAPPPYQSHPQAFSGAGSPPSYNRGKLPSYSKTLPPGHTKSISFTVDSRLDLVQPDAPPKYEAFKGRIEQQHSLPPTQQAAYEGKLKKLTEDYEKLDRVINSLETKNMYVPPKYLQQRSDMAFRRDQIRDLLGR
ncbi:RHS repeat-associated core domain-containing protein [Pseudomonas sp. UBA6562]|uniref:RHS repeat-associated core domain-containing protein n=1 Tax=Pseudomonas sp. UBA6562 TaxID=1947332 RepID=UPI0025D5BB94|nr:RHS repeat-associated core domain-containing protein [Pseudomonas sp. UBA6562]